jgi:uncharacterized protein (DUF2147 family)
VGTAASLPTINAELLRAYNLTSCRRSIKRNPPAKEACPQNGQCISTKNRETAALQATLSCAQIRAITKAPSGSEFRKSPRRKTVKITRYQIIAALFSSVTFASVAQADDASGLWLRDNGESKVKISACGAALCGYVAWVKDPAKQAGVGKKIFYDMVSAGDGKWSGKAFNPEDGKTYSGTMQLKGDKLTTAGCAFGGLVCRSVNWIRQ